MTHCLVRDSRSAVPAPGQRQQSAMRSAIRATYAHFMPDDDDRAREIMNAFFASTERSADRNPCALIVPRDRHE